MKKIIYLLSITFLMLQSCSNESSNDSSSSSSSNAQLVGKWSYFKGREFPAGTNITGNEELYLLTNECSTQKDYIEFRQDGTMKVVSYDDKCKEYPYPGTWVKSDLDLMFKMTGEPDESWEILEINTATLKLKTNIKQSSDPIYVMILKKV